MYNVHMDLHFTAERIVLVVLLPVCLKVHVMAELKDEA